jgi:hypothetical protein
VQLYNAHWLELYAVNPLLHSNPALLKPGMLINSKTQASVRCRHE